MASNGPAQKPKVLLNEIISDSKKKETLTKIYDAWHTAIKFECNAAGCPPDVLSQTLSCFPKADQQLFWRYREAKSQYNTYKRNKVRPYRETDPRFFSQF